MGDLLHGRFLNTSRLTWWYKQENEKDHKPSNCSPKCLLKSYGSSQSENCEQSTKENSDSLMPARCSMEDPCESSISKKATMGDLDTSTERNISETFGKTSHMPSVDSDGIAGHQVNEAQQISCMVSSVLIDESIATDHEAQEDHGVNGKHSSNTSRIGNESGPKVLRVEREQNRRQALLISNDIDILEDEMLMLSFDPEGVTKRGSTFIPVLSNVESAELSSSEVQKQKQIFKQVTKTFLNLSLIDGEYMVYTYSNAWFATFLLHSSGVLCPIRTHECRTDSGLPRPCDWSFDPGGQWQSRTNICSVMDGDLQGGSDDDVDKLELVPKLVSMDCTKIQIGAKILWILIKEVVAITIAQVADYIIGGMVVPHFLKRAEDVRNNSVVKLSWNSSSMCIRLRESGVFTGVLADIGFYAFKIVGILVSERQRLKQRNVNPQVDNFSYRINYLNFAKERYILINRRYYNYSCLILFGVLLDCTVSRISAAIKLLSIRSCSYLDLLMSLRDQIDKRNALYWCSCQPDRMVHFVNGLEEEVCYFSVTESKTDLFDPGGIFCSSDHVASSVGCAPKFCVSLLIDSRVVLDVITIEISMVASNEHFYTFIVCFERGVNLWHKRSSKITNVVVHVCLTTPYACSMLDLKCAMYMGTLRYESVSTMDSSNNGFSTLYLSLVFERITSLDMSTEIRDVYSNGFAHSHSVFLWTKVSTTCDNFSYDKWKEMLRTLNPAGVAQLCNLGMCGMLILSFDPGQNVKAPSMVENLWNDVNSFYCCHVVEQFYNRASRHLLNLELRCIVFTTFDPGGIVFSYKKWKHVSSSFLDVATPNGTFGTSFEFICIPRIISHSQECYIVNSRSMWFGPDGSQRRICFGKFKKTEWQEMVKLQQKKYYGIVRGRHDLDMDFLWDPTRYLELLSVQMAFGICLGGIFYRCSERD